MIELRKVHVGCAFALRGLLPAGVFMFTTQSDESKIIRRLTLLERMVVDMERLKPAEKFLRYVQVDTQSDESSGTSPTMFPACSFMRQQTKQSSRTTATR